MSEAAAGGGGGRAGVERRIIERSLEDESFRQRLLDNPKAALEEIGTRLLEEVRVVAVEETADTIYLRLPGASPLGGEGEELSDRELEEVAGGGTINGSWREYLGMPRCES
jgi:hypothetical protein